jgi:hypothetical protein
MDVTATVMARFAWHRLALAIGLGAIAGGTRKPGRSRTLLTAGLCTWALAVLAAALDVI